MSGEWHPVTDEEIPVTVLEGASALVDKLRAVNGAVVTQRYIGVDDRLVSALTVAIVNGQPVAHWIVTADDGGVAMAYMEAES